MTIVLRRSGAARSALRLGGTLPLARIAASFPLVLALFAAPSKLSKEKVAVGILHGRADAVVPVDCAVRTERIYREQRLRQAEARDRRGPDGSERTLAVAGASGADADVAGSGVDALGAMLDKAVLVHSQALLSDPATLDPKAT